MNSLDKQARQELVENLRNVYLKGSGIRGAGTKAGASKNAYIQFLKEYKGVKKPHMAYKDHKAKYNMRGGAGTKQGAIKNNYIAYQKKYKGVKPKPKYNKNIDYSKPVMPKTTEKAWWWPEEVEKPKKAPKKKVIKKGSVYPHQKPQKTTGKRGLPKKLMMYNKCLKRYRRDNPNVPYREAQKYVKQNINYNTGQCKGMPRIEQEEEGDIGLASLGLALDDYGGLLMDYGGALDDYGGALDDYGGGLRDYYNQGHLGF
jgi:hypothetical protein